jgi:hypothetical protein
MKILFNNPVMLNNTTGKNSTNKNTCQPELRKLDKDTVQFSGKQNFLDPDFYKNLNNYIGNLPERSVAKSFGEQIRLICTDGLKPIQDCDLQILAKLVLIEHKPKVLELCEYVKNNSTNQRLINAINDYTGLLPKNAQ